MPKALQLNIAEPCHENWQNMTPQQQGRFCGSCQKTVVDFTMMSNQEVLNYFLKTDQNVCGRFARDQLNKDLIVTPKKKRFTWAYVWNILVATFLVTKADAQVEPKPTVPVEINERQPKIMGKIAYVRPASVPVVINGQVVDEKNNQPVVGASISIKGAGGVCMTDAAGKFSLKVDKKDAVLEFSAVGYETQTVEYDEFSLKNIKVSLKSSYTSLQEVVVIGYERTHCQMAMGAVSTTYTTTLKEKVVKNINDWVPAALKNDVKVYPNPVVRGNSLTVSLSLQQAGAYKLEVLNAAGQVMQVQPLLMQTKAQVIDLHTPVSWSAGIYWLRISSPNTKNVYQRKILIK